jgi:hypothetical protein
VSGAENGAERAEKLVSGSGAGLSKKRGAGARSGRSVNGNGAMSGLNVS